MSYWRHRMVDGAGFLIKCQRLRIMSKASHWQLIQNLAPSTIVWRQCDIQIRKFHSWPEAPKLYLRKTIFFMSMLHFFAFQFLLKNSVIYFKILFSTCVLVRFLTLSFIYQNTLDLSIFFSGNFAYSAFKRRQHHNFSNFSCRFLNPNNFFQFEL